MPLRTTPTMDYHIHNEDTVVNKKTSSNDEESMSTTNASTDTPMIGTKTKVISLRSWLLSSSWKIWLILAVFTMILTITVVVTIVVTTSPKKRRQIDQYASNHGIKKLLENGTSAIIASSKTYCDRNDAFTNTTNDDGTTQCSGTCYVEFRNILVPSTGYNNGCNTCICDPNSNTGFKCTMNVNCTSSVCNYNGWYYQPGDIVPHASNDSCNTCKCQKYYNETRASLMKGKENETYYNKDDVYDYKVVCTENECNTCAYEGEIYEIGESFVGNGCPSNICTCNSYNNVTCTNLEKNGGGGEEEEQGDKANCEGYCTWEGYVYETYQCFKSKVNKNICSCMENGNVACTDCENMKYDM